MTKFHRAGTLSWLFSRAGLLLSLLKLDPNNVLDTVRFSRYQCTLLISVLMVVIEVLIIVEKEVFKCVVLSLYMR